MVHPQGSAVRGSKVVVIGLDGGCFNVIDPLIKEGKLPTLERLLKEGVRSTLLSTIPPVTGPAWASFMTGKSPGLHGLFDFVKPSRTKVGRQVVNYKHIRAKTLWSLLSENDKKICVINVPLTYPPPKVQGCLISGMLTPSIHSPFTYPPSLSRELKDKWGEYVIDIGWQQYGPKTINKFLQDLMDCTDQRSDIALHLMKTREWDFFMTVFVGTDRIQHALWHFLFPSNGNTVTDTEKIMRKLIIKYYQKIDDTIRKVVDATDGNANVIIMSDHGFGPLQGKFYINKWLEDAGLLAFNRKKITKYRLKNQLVRLLGTTIKKVDFLRLRKKLLAHTTPRSTETGVYSFLDYIDWSKTKAYAASNTEQGIYLNLSGREPCGIVTPGKEYNEVRESIIKRLKNLEHPHTREKMVSMLCTKEEIYSGLYSDNAPDIIFFLKEGEYLADVQPADYLFEEISWKTGTGTHRREGMFLGYGKDIKQGIPLKDAHIIDLAPTILTLMNVPIPTDMDGKVLTEILSDKFLMHNQPRYVDPSVEQYPDSEGDQLYTDTETAQVEERLRELGYL